MPLSISIESPNQPAVLKMLRALDRYLETLYPPASNHLVDVDALANPQTIFCVARDKHEPVGCGAAMLKYNCDQPYAEIKRMYVHKNWRRAGVGSEILNFLHAEVASNGISISRLETGFSQVHAIQLYESSGYYLVPPFGEYKPDPLSLFYEKKI